MILFASLVLAAATPAAAPPPADPSQPYRACLRTANIRAPGAPEFTPVAAVARAIEACAKERAALVERLVVAKGKPVNRLDTILAAQQANRDVVEIEIEAIRQSTRGQAEPSAQASTVPPQEKPVHAADR